MDDTRTTLGRRFRTAAHPEVVAALGRAVYCFLNVEASVVSVLYGAGAVDLATARGKMAGEKEAALRELAASYRSSRNGAEVADALDVAVADFRRARMTVRNELLHAHPFTVGYDNDGIYLPGLAFTAKDGKSWKTLARGPDDLLDMAIAIEEAIDPLSQAREAVTALPLADLEL